jgi:hypothetical protein
VPRAFRPSAPHDRAAAPRITPSTTQFFIGAGQLGTFPIATSATHVLANGNC